MKKNIFSIIIMLVIIITAGTNVLANDGLFDVNAYTTTYKLSEQEDINLPFYNVFSGNAVYDKDVTHSGITIGSAIIDINSKMEGIQLIFSGDMININGEIEHALIYGKNIVVTGKITDDVILIAPSVQILESAEVTGDVIVVANELYVKGTVYGNVIANVTIKADITGNIKGDLRVVTESINVNDSTIEGNVYVETNADTTTLKNKYPNAIITSTIQTKSATQTALNVFSKGIVYVVVYGVVCFFITKKENNIFTTAYNKFKDNTMYGILLAFIVLMLALVVPMISLILMMIGLESIGLPLFIAYTGFVLLVLTIADIIVGATMYEAIKDKVEKYRIIAIAAIFIVLFAITNIPYIAWYAVMAIKLIALAIVMTMITKKTEEVKK